MCACKVHVKGYTDEHKLNFRSNPTLFACQEKWHCFSYRSFTHPASLGSVSIVSDSQTFVG